MHVTRIIMELYRDKRHVIDAMTQNQLKQSVRMLKKYQVLTARLHGVIIQSIVTSHLLFFPQHPTYLHFLSILCVCSDVALPRNQDALCKELVTKQRGYLFRFELREGQVFASRKKKSEKTLRSLFQVRAPITCSSRLIQTC